MNTNSVCSHDYVRWLSHLNPHSYQDTQPIGMTSSSTGTWRSTSLQFSSSRETRCRLCVPSGPTQLSMPPNSCFKEKCCHRTKLGTYTQSLYMCTCGVCVHIICDVLVYICIITLASCELHVLHALMNGLLFP